MRRLLGAAAGAAATLAALLAVAGSAAAAPGHLTTQSGRWITDAKGRIVIVHGLNMVYKLPPYYPAKTGFGGDDARFLERHGFNGVRLGVIYAGVEPKAGRYDDHYLTKIAKTQRTLARHRVFSLIDFHQDQYNEKFQGEGWPDYQVEDDGLPNPQNGFPGNYETSPALNRAFDHFWANDEVGGVRLLDEYAAAWRHVAHRFRNANRVLGYDLLNEPWPGQDWPLCAQPVGCSSFDRGPLATMTRKATRAVRKADRRHIVWQEPAVLFNFGAPSHLPAIGSNTGFSFHVYCLVAGAAGCPTLEALPFDNADDVAKATDRALLLSEFGSTDDLTDLSRVEALADEHQVSWLEWAYTGYDPTGSIPPSVEALVKDPSKPPRGANVKRDKLLALERAYPQIVAGTPRGYDYDPDTGRFTLTYSTRAPAGGRLPRSAETVVFVPRIHYHGHYRVDVEGARVVSKRGAQRLRLRRRRHASRVSLTITPRGGGFVAG